MYYVGMDLHKKSVVYRVIAADGRDQSEGRLTRPTPQALADWGQALATPWIGAMEATLFTQHVYQALLPFAHDLQVGDSRRVRMMNPNKHKNDRRDALHLAQLARCGLMPRVHMLNAQAYELRQALRYRNTLVRESVRMRNKTAGLLMEAGQEYDKRRLHGSRYFVQLLDDLEDVPETVVDLLKHSHAMGDLFASAQKRILTGLSRNAALQGRIVPLMAPKGIGIVTALTWALEVGDPHRFSSIAHAISYCGLCAAEEESDGKRSRRHSQRSRRFNPHLCATLIEAAKLAPRHNTHLAAVHAEALERTKSENLATIAVARKLVAWLLAIDKRTEDFAAQPH